MTQKCELCEREVPKLTVHHLRPRQTTKRKKAEIGPTASICSACHRQVHVLFDNKRLARELDSIEKLQAEPQMQKFLAWVRKQSPHKRVSVKR